jgi:hypothetical protein
MEFSYLLMIENIIIDTPPNPLFLEGGSGNPVISPSKKRGLGGVLS